MKCKRESYNINRREAVQLPVFQSDTKGGTFLRRFIARPCPFCGEQPYIKGWHGGGRDKRVVSCESDYCHANPSVSGGSRPVALNRWNTRTNRIT